jgi:uncharacterized protein (TIGR03000 family)
MLLTAGHGTAQVFNTSVVNGPYGFTFYTYPAGYTPPFPTVGSWWGEGGWGAAGGVPYYSPYGNWAVVDNPFLLQGAQPRAVRPAAMPRSRDGAALRDRRSTTQQVLVLPRETTATIALRTPADARVWVEGREMTQAGTLRSFVSPRLAPDRVYGYDIRVSWTEDGHEVVRRQHVSVRAGDDQTVTFVSGLSAAARVASRTASR